MKGNGRMGKDMVKEHTLFLMEESMLVNGGLGKNMVKGHTLGLVERNM